MSQNYKLFSIHLEMVCVDSHLSYTFNSANIVSQYKIAEVFLNILV